MIIQQQLLNLATANKGAWRYWGGNDHFSSGIKSHWHSNFLREEFRFSSTAKFTGTESIMF